MDILRIEALYKRYGFETRKTSENVVTFLYKKGRYFGADLIKLNESAESDDEIRKLNREYSRLAYAVNIKSFSNEQEIEQELFKSFFSYDSTINRLKKKYHEFEQKQTKSLLGNSYQYIESPFELYDGFDVDESKGLLNDVLKIIDRETPQLLIIEAAAGYGKTCAAYEILNHLIQDSNKISTPLFTELSKNRGANIFRYILLDEIDTEFPTLNSELVINEIKNGRIPLIIDGFDELLDKVNISNIDISTAFDEIETMLDTIGNLLENKAKIILTTRKTAIFSGLEFDKWYEKWNKKFQVSRFSLKEPRIKDWLGMDRFNVVKDHNVPIQYIANPVLLTYLKNVPIEDFAQQIKNPEILVKNYFDKMLERERERQNLIISTQEQYEIFKNVARMLLEFDITVESKEFFKEIIKDQNSKLLEFTRTLYTGQEKPTLENLVDSLATHALLDRKGRDESKIGFINDFVLGSLIGEIICESSVEKIEKDYSYYMLELAFTAFKVQNHANKSILWEKINAVKHKLQPISIFQYDLVLKESLCRDYFDLSIYDYMFFNITFKGHFIENSVFLNCYFKNCIFDTNHLKNISFVDCTFDNCKVENEKYLDHKKEISAIKCKLKGCEILEEYLYHKNEDESIFDELETTILSVLWSNSDAKSQHIIKVLQYFSKPQQKQVTNAINSLAERDYLKLRGSHVNLSINKLHIIKSHLEV